MELVKRTIQYNQMRTFTAILVDDEPAGLRTLSAKIEWSNLPIQIIGQVNSVKRAIPLIEEQHPDLIFLDIKMPEQDGFSLFDHLDTAKCDVIFTTAHDEFALKAFKYQASGYLLKPISQRELNPLLEDIMHKRGMNSQSKKIASFRSQGDIVQFDQNEISHILSDGIKSHIYTLNNKSVEISSHLKKVEIELTNHHFCRIHHQSIVNLRHISKIHQARNAHLIMSDGTLLEISRSRKMEFYKRYQEFIFNQ